MVANFGKKGNRDFFTSQLLFKAVGVIFVITIIFLILADIKIYQKKRTLLSQINTYKKQIEDIEKSSRTLKDEIANSNSVEYLEKLAYEQLGQQKPGEKQVIFIMPEEKVVTEIAEPESFWSVNYWLGQLNGGWQWIKSKF